MVPSSLPAHPASRSRKSPTTIGPGIERQLDGPGDGHGAGRAAGVLVGDASLIVGRPDEGVGVVPEHEPHGSRPHGAAVAGRRWRCPGPLPGDAGGEAGGRLRRRPAAADDAAFAEDRGDAGRVVRRVKGARGHIALHQLPRELGVVRVLADGEGATSALGRPTALQDSLHVGAAARRRVTFHHEPERVAEALADEAALEPILGGSRRHHRCAAHPPMHALTNAAAASVSHSAAPVNRPTSFPSASISTVVGSPER